MKKETTAQRDPLEKVKAALEKKQYAAVKAEIARLRGASGEVVSPTDLDYFAAVTERLSGNYEAALGLLKALIEVRPEFGRAYQESGYNYVSLRMPVEAVGAFRMAVEHNPVLVASWQMLVKLHRILKESRQAEFAQAKLEWLAKLPKPILAARDLFHEGKLAKAEALCRDFLKTHPKHIEGMRLLAEIGIHLKIYDDAEFILESCVTFSPGHHGARLDYAKILNRKGKFGRALEEAEVLVGSQSENPAFQLARANALNGLGRFDEAIAIYEKWVTRQEDASGLQVMLGHAYKAKGALQKAVTAYQNAYKSRPEYGDAYWSLANAKTYRFSQEEVQAMLKWADSPGVGIQDRIHLNFALGKALEDGRDYAAAFQHYAEGNALKMRLSGYRAETTTRMVDRQIELMDSEFFSRRGVVGHSANDPIFILGLPRAGSTLLEQILASHSQVEGTMELHTILGIAQRLRGRSAEKEGRYPGILEELDGDYFRRFGEQFIEQTRVFRVEGTPYFIDKMPNNFLHIGLIRLILPNAKIIDARRHPMACCFSGFKQLFGEGQDFSYSLETMGAYYRDYVRLMAHWDRVLPGTVLRVQHEDVIEDLEREVRRILDFCGLPFEAACLEFHKSRRAVRTPSSEQVRQPIYRSAMQQWEHFEPWLGPLKTALGKDLLRAYGISIATGS
jgi:predicted Zn-dependent protease